MTRISRTVQLIPQVLRDTLRWRRTDVHHTIAAVMIHVPDVHEALDWYSMAFPEAVRTKAEDPNFEFLWINGVQLELVLSDEKVSSGAAGSVVYWAVGEFESALHHFQSIGASLYRGPMKIERNMAMCQVRDPWGNCIGLRGPRAASEASGNEGEL